MQPNQETTLPNQETTVLILLNQKTIPQHQSMTPVLMLSHLLLLMYALTPFGSITIKPSLTNALP
jgi:hypothetical protein